MSENDAQSPHDLPFEYRVERRDGYVFVWQRGRAVSQADVVSMQREAEDAMRAVGARRVVFDNRETGRPNEWVRAAMWSWLTENISRAALLQSKASNIRRVQERGHRNRLLVRGFHREDEAVQWLLSVR